MIACVEQARQERIAGGDRRRAAFEEARRRYYDEIDRRKSKPGARAFVDKLPIRSAWIEVMEKFFPEKRYIFSIRHPFDVVLSCFKQYVGRNIAMEHFRVQLERELKSRLSLLRRKYLVACGNACRNACALAGCRL